MLAAKCDGAMVEAAAAAKGQSFICPSPACGAPLVLKQGRIVSAHFAHKPPFHCDWGGEESAAHRAAKILFRDAIAARGLAVELECYTPFPNGTARRADLLATSPSGRPVAFEFQKTNIGLAEIEARAFSYAAHGYAQIWIPIAKPDIWKTMKKDGENRWKIERFAPSQFEKWISGLYMGKDYWLFEPLCSKILIVHTEKVKLLREATAFYQDGEERVSNEFYYNSKRFRSASVSGPFDVAEFRIALSQRKEFASGPYRWPGGWTAHLVRQSAD